MNRRVRKMIGQSFIKHKKIGIVITGNSCAPEQSNFFRFLKFLHHIVNPPQMLVGTRAQQTTAKLLALFCDHDTRTQACGTECGRQSSRSTANNQHIAPGIDLVVTVGVGFRAHFPESGRAPDHLLVEHPSLARIHESLVVEPGLEKRGEPSHQRCHIE